MSTALMLLIGFALIAGSLSIIIVMLKSKHFFKCLFFSVFTGVGALLVVHFTSLMTGFSLPVNWVSLASSALGGLPSVLAMIAIKFF